MGGCRRSHGGAELTAPLTPPSRTGGIRNRERRPSSRTGISCVELRLPPLLIDDEAAFRATREVMVAESGFEVGFGMDTRRAWPQYVSQIEAKRHGFGLAAGHVPETFLVTVVDGAPGL